MRNSLSKSAEITISDTKKLMHECAVVVRELIDGGSNSVIIIRAFEIEENFETLRVSGLIVTKEIIERFYAKFKIKPAPPEITRILSLMLEEYDEEGEE